MLDIEEGSPTQNMPAATFKALRAGFADLSCKLKAAMVAKTPGAILTWAMPLTPHTAVEGDVYDYAAMLAC